MRTLKEVRKDKGVKQRAVADHLKISRQSYSRYENNPEKMPIGLALAACDFLGVNVRDIFFDSMLS